MIKNLVIVESPAKAKTIEGYLGKDFVVKSSFGHVRDLPKGNNAIDVEHGFKPTYVVSSDKKEVVSQLRKLAKEAEMVWLASDDDREGEAISWHLTEALNLNDQKTRRIVFREITKNAILNAISTPRGIDMDLVNAQQARRILDRLVGFELSPVLWKKIKTGLSAGRVQSVAVRLVVEREREIERFNAESSFRITANFDVEGRTLEAELPSKFKTEEEAQAFLQACIGADYTIENLEKKPLKRSPAPPFTTSTLQQEASRKLYFSVAQTMTVAQRLYEAGKISYMRTDSVNLSDEAIQGATREIQSSFGEKFVKTRRFKTKSASAQEAHEAIRPTDFSQMVASSDRNEQRLYELIWKRAIASQMADAEIEKTTVTIGVSTQPEQKLQATGEVIKFEGFLKVYIESKDDDEDGADEDVKGMLPPLRIGQQINLRQMLATQRFTRPAARYTEASLVKKLEEMGIGRPSTYAPTISTIQKRGYVEKDTREGKERSYKVLTLKDGSVDSQTKTEITGAEKAKLFPTDMAMVVNDFLVDHFPNVIDYSFTARVEAEFDEIAQGQKEWENMLDQFYQKFHQRIESSENISRADVSGARELGTDPATGKTIIAKLGRFGPYVQLGEENEETGEKPVYASLRKGQFIETITLEDALELFKLPRVVGAYEDKDMTAAIGRFGPYIRHNSKFYSLPKHLDPLQVTEQEAIELIEAKRKADAEKLIKSFPENEEVQVLNGRYGPYIVVGKKNVKIPKGKEPAELTLQECLDLAEATPEKKGRGGFKKAAAADKAEKKPAAKKPAAKGKTAAKATTKKAPAKKKPASK
ncbi:DNA topoisomerase I [Pontibacter ummariensis]|uniref:DNA topoisomerase 1 n=1 Tax=Pontibacter ummariensis TaxID=1610492 RepID=A0A239C8R6_9BACT|nr:type I DNA topoisomerase [Pontibacter ummariensis]PRY15388.1 DNA topoisomerase I [Pontibacter ummariensis]SNS16500.1 DNA topoisomerase I [Pontibacter ummariensis]